MKEIKLLILIFVLLILSFTSAGATPTTLIWAPSTDIQPYKKIHLNVDNYTPVRSKDNNGNHLYVQQIYGPTFSLLSDRPAGNGLASDSQSHRPAGNGLASDSQSHRPAGNGLASDSQSHRPENNLLGKLWSPLGKIMAETGFDYKKGFGPTLDKWPVYFHFKLGVSEDAYFKYMPAFAVGCYDMGYKHDYTNNNVWYLRGAKTLNIGKLNLGRFSAGYFNGNGRILRDQDSLRDNIGPMFAWERTMSEINDKLWLCVDYQGTKSAYGAMNYGFAWKFTNNISAIIGYDVCNNPNYKDTVTFQLDIDF